MGMIFSVVDAAQQWINENVSTNTSEQPCDNKVIFISYTLVAYNACLPKMFIIYIYSRSWKKKRKMTQNLNQSSLKNPSWQEEDGSMS